MTLQELTAERLRQILAYDPETGVFTWLAPMRACFIGRVAGSVNAQGYRVINICKGLGPLTEHRLAWLYMTGEWPKGQVDHRNCQRSDNRWSNLRDVSQIANIHNTHKPSRRNATGIRGVGKHFDGYRARLMAFGKRHDLGIFESSEAAAAAYATAKAQLHPGSKP